MEAFENGFNEINSVENLETTMPDASARAMIAKSATRSWVEGDPFMRIVEQPHPTLYRFRYKSEGRLAGTMPGINSTDNKKTVPIVEVLNYTGSIDILVSCVTVEEPYLQHPHKLVGKKNSKNGVHCIHLKGPPMQAALNNVGIRCVRKDGIENSLKDRKENINFDPFGGGYDHKDQNVNLSAVRLCFQGFIPIGPKRYHKLQPVVSEPITDKKHVYELVINRLCSCSDKSFGGTEILMFCSPLLNADVQIRFYEEKHGWEAFAKFEKTDVHLKCGIAFRTPPYRDVNIEEPVEVELQLVRFSTETLTSAQKPIISQSSQPKLFTYYPDPDRYKRSRLEGQVKKMHNWVHTVNNLENTASNQTAAVGVQSSLEQTVIPPFAPSQGHLNGMDCYESVLNSQAENTTTLANNPFNSTVEPLADSESQMEYQLQQLLQIWQSQEPPMSGQEVQPHLCQSLQHVFHQAQPIQPFQMHQQYNPQFDLQGQQTQLPTHPQQSLIQPMLQSNPYQTFQQQNQSQNLYIAHEQPQQQQFGQMQLKQSGNQLQAQNIQMHAGQLPHMQMQYNNNYNNETN